jgi:hypothetical protein
VIVTPRLSVDIVRYLQRRTDGLPQQWVALSDVAGAVRGTDDSIFAQAVDLARCRGWIFVEGKSTTKRACLTKAGCLLVAEPKPIALERHEALRV